MPVELSSNVSPLVPSLSQSTQTTLTFSSSSSSSSDKWFVDINNSNNRNFGTDKRNQTVYDVRGQENKTKVDVTGFEAFSYPSEISSSLLLSGNEDEIKKHYYPEVEKLIKERTGASRVVFFDHTVRKLRPTAELGVSDPTERQPVLQTHVDQTPASAHVRVDRHVVPPVPYKRFQLINVWRPIQNTVYDYPLAVCDFNTVDVINDLEPTTLVYPDPIPNGETYSVKYNKNQVWWYWSEMTPNDVIMLKCYDSSSKELYKIEKSGAKDRINPDELLEVAGLTPHTAFYDAEGEKKGKGIQRQSIEVRALVFYD